MTETPEIPDEARGAAARAACEAAYPPSPTGRAKVHDSWAEIEEWERDAWRATAGAAITAALPHLNPPVVSRELEGEALEASERWYADMHGEDLRSERPGSLYEALVADEQHDRACCTFAVHWRPKRRLRRYQHSLWICTCGEAWRTKRGPYERTTWLWRRWNA